jgi:hypothetical protein
MPSRSRSLLSLTIETMVNKTNHQHCSIQRGLDNADEQQKSPTMVRPAAVTPLVTFPMVAGISERICYRKGCFLKHIRSEIPSSIGNIAILMIIIRSSSWQIFYFGYVSKYEARYVSRHAPKCPKSQTYGSTYFLR